MDKNTKKIKKAEKPPKQAHARSKFDLDQGIYIAKLLKPKVDNKKLTKIKDICKETVRLSDEFIKINGHGRKVKEIGQTTMYTFMKQHNINPPNKHDEDEDDHEEVEEEKVEEPPQILSRKSSRNNQGAKPFNRAELEKQLAFHEKEVKRLSIVALEG